MSEDLAGLIARQKAEQAARESQPGRYDGVELNDLAHRIEMEAQGLAAWKASNDVEPTVEPDARLRVVASLSPQAAAAFGLLNAGATAIVPIDESGRPLTKPTRDFDAIASWFESGPYVDKWPAIPCGEVGGLFGLLVYPGEGENWFREIATIHTPTRAERLTSWVADRIDALGVPGRSDDWDAEEPQPQADQYRAPMDARLWMVEDVPAHRAVVRSWTGPTRGRDAQAALAAARPQQPRQLEGRVWSWPAGQSLPVGRELRKGVEALSVVPALGAVLEVAAVRFVVRQVPALLSPPPDWLISAIRELA